MKLIEVLPYVRFAYKIMLKSNRPCITMDSRLFYITEGEGTILINGKKYSFSAGTLFLWQAGTKYNFLTPSTVSMISINFDFTQDNSSRTQPIPIVYLNDDDKAYTKPKQIICEEISDSRIFVFKERKNQCRPHYYIAWINRQYQIRRIA